MNIMYCRRDIEQNVSSRRVRKVVGKYTCLILMTMLTTASPAQADKELRPGPSPGCTYVFPQDRSFGSIYLIPESVTLKQPLPQMKFFAAAKGVVHVKERSRVVYKANALITEKPELLDSLPECTIGLVLKELDINDATFVHASKLRNLAFLSLEGTEITDQSLKVVSGFKGLCTLDVSSTAIDGSGFGYLKSLHSLVVLRATHDNLKYWRGLESLQTIGWLDVRNSGVDDKALESISKLESLDSLEVPHSKITNAGLKALRKIPKLRTLNLRYTPVNTEGLYGLRGLHLQRVLLSANQINDKDIEPLSKILPGVKISKTANQELQKNATVLFGPLH